MQTLTNQSADKALLGCLQRGHVYRREDLRQYSRAVDRHLGQLVGSGAMTKLSQGLYGVPRVCRFGVVPPTAERVVAAFLRGGSFLMFSPSAYNCLGLGTTQLYNTQVVYNRKRHGMFTLGGKVFDFRVKPHFPKTLTPAFLWVDLLNNLAALPEDSAPVLALSQQKWAALSASELKATKAAVAAYGSQATRKLLQSWATAC